MQRILYTTAILLGLTVLTVADSATAAESMMTEPTVTTAPMEAHPMDPREPAPNDLSTLVRNQNGIAAAVRTSGLDAAAYTIWWVIFNHPEFCLTSPCTADDLPANGGDPRVEASAVFADGLLIGELGRARAAAGLAANDTSDALYGPGLIEPFGAEIHLLLKSHGEVQLELVHEQITVPSGGCPKGGCTDQQFTIHLP